MDTLLIGLGALLLLCLLSMPWWLPALSAIAFMRSQGQNRQADTADPKPETKRASWHPFGLKQDKG
jgi:hypothetical protein